MYIYSPWGECIFIPLGRVCIYSSQGECIFIPLWDSVYLFLLGRVDIYSSLGECIFIPLGECIFIPLGESVYLFLLGRVYIYSSWGECIFIPLYPFIPVNQYSYLCNSADPDEMVCYCFLTEKPYLKQWMCPNFKMEESM